MVEADSNDLKEVVARIRTQAQEKQIRITQHAHQEMAEEDIALDEVEQAIADAMILEKYPNHRRGACCLLYGTTHGGRPLHIVCTTARPMLIIITVYEPKPPKWLSPSQRRPSQ